MKISVEKNTLRISYSDPDKKMIRDPSRPSLAHNTAYMCVGLKAVLGIRTFWPDPESSPPDPDPDPALVMYIYKVIFSLKKCS
jgi:hypothetical protein